MSRSRQGKIVVTEATRLAGLRARRAVAGHLEGTAALLRGFLT